MLGHGFVLGKIILGKGFVLVLFLVCFVLVDDY